MINKIELNTVASFKTPSTLKTDKKVNLIYGLNGTGKTTLSDFLYDNSEKKFSDCKIEGWKDERILVYNQKFINDYFYESDSLQGIFTLSKENKDAEQKIIAAQNKIAAIEAKKDLKIQEKEKIEEELQRKYSNSEGKVWEIKTKYTGGDRVLEFCLDGLKGKKESLFNHILDIDKPDIKPNKSIDQLKKEVESLKGENAQPINKVPLVTFNKNQIENDDIFKKTIVGNKNSTVAGLINNLDNSDWVKKGLNYLPEEIQDEPKTCPFCQKDTISRNLLNDIKDYFDESYESDIKSLKDSLEEYEVALNSIPAKETYLNNSFVNDKKIDFERRYNQLITVLLKNKNNIVKKIDTPSIPVTLQNSLEYIKALNEVLKDINQEILTHNERIENKVEALNQVKENFWSLMRWDYDQTISVFQEEKRLAKNKSKSISDDIKQFDIQIKAQKQIIKEQQKETVSIQDAIDAINNSLIDLGISDFQIEKFDDSFYKLVRDEQKEKTFKTLSEGEKMIISFLYFLELCEGKESATDLNQEKIVVIDDPVSSLSHIFVFNVGQLIKKRLFLSEKFKQVFVLTHSLYFFYELTDIKHDRRKKNQNLFRMIKNSKGSQILDMKYEEIQNDYQSYWTIVKDKEQPPALIANCMRNIIEYFFSFIEEKDINNVFQKPELQDNKYQAFNRFINRESHSLGQNIFDYKEFDYEIFREGLRLVFDKSGYIDHYNAMIK